jgi:hypothetical protein
MNFSTQVFAVMTELTIPLPSSLSAHRLLPGRTDHVVTVADVLDLLDERGLLLDSTDDFQLVDAVSSVGNQPLFQPEIGFGDAPEHLVSSLNELTAQVDLKAVVAGAATSAPPAEVGSRSSVVGLDAIAISADGLLLGSLGEAGPAGRGEETTEGREEGETEMVDVHFRVSIFEVVKILAEVFNPAHVTKIKTQRAENSEEISLAEFLQSEITQPEFNRLIYRIAEAKSAESNGKLPVSSALNLLAHKFK